MYRPLAYSLILPIFWQISNTQPEEISFRIHQEMKVGILQPAAVSVYEYSDSEFVDLSYLL